jgi:hypothetical protein
MLRSDWSGRRARWRVKRRPLLSGELMLFPDYVDAIQATVRGPRLRIKPVNGGLGTSAWHWKISMSQATRTLISLLLIRLTRRRGLSLSGRF